MCKSELHSIFKIAAISTIKVTILHVNQHQHEEKVLNRNSVWATIIMLVYLGQSYLLSLNIGVVESFIFVFKPADQTFQFENMLSLRPPVFEFRVMCLVGSVISFISPFS